MPERGGRRPLRPARAMTPVSSSVAAWPAARRAERVRERPSSAARSRSAAWFHCIGWPSPSSRKTGWRSVSSAAAPAAAVAAASARRRATAAARCRCGSNRARDGEFAGLERPDGEGAEQRDVLDPAIPGPDREAQPLLERARAEIFVVHLASQQLGARHDLPGRDHFAGDADRLALAPDVPAGPGAQELLLVILGGQAEGDAGEVGVIVAAGEAVGEMAAEQAGETLEHQGPAFGRDGAVIGGVENGLDRGVIHCVLPSSRLHSPARTIRVQYKLCDFVSRSDRPRKIEPVPQPRGPCLRGVRTWYRPRGPARTEARDGDGRGQGGNRAELRGRAGPPRRHRQARARARGRDRPHPSRRLRRPEPRHAHRRILDRASEPGDRGQALLPRRVHDAQPAPAGCAHACRARLEIRHHAGNGAGRRVRARPPVQGDRDHREGRTRRLRRRSRSRC